MDSEEIEKENTHPTYYSEATIGHCYSPEHFNNWETITEGDVYYKTNYILYQQAHLVPSEISKFFLNRRHKTIFAIQELKTIRRLYELYEIPQGWQIKFTETRKKKNSNEITETQQLFFFGIRSQQLFNEETWKNELKLYDTEERLKELFEHGNDHLSEYNRNNDICILTYKKLKEAKEYITLLESKLKNENVKNLDLDAILREKEKKETESNIGIKKLYKPYKRLSLNMAFQMTTLTSVVRWVLQHFYQIKL